MAHANTVSWSDFYDDGLGPSLPLTAAQQQQLISGVLPSGEAGLFDQAQSHKLRHEAAGFRGSGINAPFPYPNENTASKYAFMSDENPTLSPDKFSEAWWEASGIFKTYPAEEDWLADSQRESGILHYNGPSGRFSNGEQAKSRQIENFNIFNNYIHHQRMPTNATNGSALLIPYVSTYRISIDWNPYG